MFNMRKDIKKSSYYVWFLGAQEAKGFRGAEYMVPVIAELVEREKKVEPYKVTLQASYKGLKIIRNIAQENPGKKGPEPEVIKHFIPHQAITCIYREEDLVACILLLYNPVTKCPLHVHVYRCDSVETAAVLASQLQTLVDRPDNQKKLAEIEGRLKSKNSRARDSESSGGSLSSGVSSQEKIASLYDSLAAELKEKLGTGPILLPPRDYDTVHRRKGDLTDIENRRCLNASVVGRLAGRQSPCSSGIGSDKAPSPDRERHRYFERASSSDEEWTPEQYRQGHKNWAPNDLPAQRPKRTPIDNLDWKQLNAPSTALHQRMESSISMDGPARRRDHDMEKPHIRSFGDPCDDPPQRWARSPQERQRTPSPAKRTSMALGQNLTARERFQDAKEKFLSLERNEQERMLQIGNDRRKAESSQNPVVPVFRPHLIRSHSHSKTDEETEEHLKPSFSLHDEQAQKYFDDVCYNQALHAHNIRNNNFSESSNFNRLSYASEKDNLEDRNDEIAPNVRVRHQYVSEYNHPSNNHKHRRDKGVESPEKSRYENVQRTLHQLPPDNQGEDSGGRSKRHHQYYREDDTPVPLQRYRSPERIRVGSKFKTRPGLYPSRSTENIDETKNSSLSHLENQHYQNKQLDEKKRRSMYESVQEERKRNSNQLAKEFMKRSHLEQRTSYKDLKDQEHFSHSERELNRKPEDISARYRHSYVEPISRTQDHRDIQRVSRSAVSPQRVGIAALHPY